MKSGVLSVSNQRVKRFSLPFDDYEVELLVNFHTETDLGEGSVPVGGQFGFLSFKSSFLARKVVFFIITPVRTDIVKG